MAVFGIRTWWQRLRTPTDAGPTGGLPSLPPGVTDQGPVPLDDCALKAYAMQQPEWAKALIQVESARVTGEIRLLSVRLLLGTACGSVLLFSVTVAARVAPSVPVGAGTPLTTAVIGAVSAAILTAMGAALGKALRSRSTGTPGGSVSDDASRVPERPSGGGSEPGGAP
ncbi:hypothetical protein AS200_34010 [Streptomyces sp. CdTB01]|nr:hypothetical protein AS200_34010 [Streptomyces sp. CdTB01]